MAVSFDNLLDHIIPMNDFILKLRFTEAEYNILPDSDLKQIKPLDTDAAKFFWDFIIEQKLHNNIPFKKDFFRSERMIYQEEGNEQVVKNWLSNTGVPLEKEVYLSYDNRVAIIAPWELVIKYYEDFQYADDLTVFDKTLNWAVLFFHEGRIYFGEK